MRNLFGKEVCCSRFLRDGCSQKKVGIKQSGLLPFRYRPSHCGSRFSRKAEIPSFASLELKARIITSFT